MQLRTTYVQLHEEQVGRLISSAIPMHLDNQVNYPFSWAGNIANLQYAIPAGARVKNLYVGSFFKSAEHAIVPVDGTTIAAG